MMHSDRWYTLPLLGAGFLVLVALASFLILDLSGPGPDSASSLAVVDIGGAGVGSTGQEAAEGLSSATTAALPGAQASVSGQQGGPGDPSSSERDGGSGEPAGPGLQGGMTDRRGNGGSASTTIGAPHSGAPGTEASPGMSAGAPPGTIGEHISESNTTGSTLRQTISGGVRVEHGPRSGPGSGAGSTPATTGGAR